MKLTRIIPRLDIKGSNLVKGVNFEGLRVLGKPQQFAEYYYQSGADELLYVDIVASLYQRNSLTKFVRKTVSSIFIPLTVAGGIRSLDDIYELLTAGADKVAINTAAFDRPEFISEAALRFGTSTVVVSMEVAGNLKEGYTCYTDNGRVATGWEAVSWAKKVEQMGAGEILLTSVSCEGMKLGLDLILVEKITNAVSIPVIVGGGCGSFEHILQGLDKGADAVSVASILHYPAAATLNTSAEGFSEGNLDFLRSLIANKGMDDDNGSVLEQVKLDLLANGYIGRPLQ